MSRIKPADIIAVILSFLPFALFLALCNSLADRIPIHWNTAGEVDGWTPRAQLPIFLGIIAASGIGVYLMLRFIKKIDPKRAAQLNEAVAVKIGLGIVTFLAAINILIVVPHTNRFNTTTIVLLLASLLLTFVGNFMYNIKPNYFIGIRLPWTLGNENNWKLTHRFAGITWFIGGIISAILSMFIGPKTMFIIFVAITIFLFLVPSVYSFILYKRMTHHSQSE